jgi:hypothetical protein
VDQRDDLRADEGDHELEAAALLEVLERDRGRERAGEAAVPAVEARAGAGQREADAREVVAPGLAAAHAQQEAHVEATIEHHPRADEAVAELEAVGEPQRVAAGHAGVEGEAALIVAPGAQGPGLWDRLLRGRVADGAEQDPLASGVVRGEAGGLRVGGEVEEGGDRRVREGQHRVVRGSAA